MGASKSCFIACPDEPELQPLLELLTEKLAKVGVEAIVAVRVRAYGQDVFCTKICGKIIESMFCVVILDDVTQDGCQLPNPNVYYEYGLMTALGKHVVPLQKANMQLAFNIQTHDTVKYSPENLGRELDRAIKDALTITSHAETPAPPGRATDKSLRRQFELAGLEVKGDSWFLSDAVADTCFLGVGGKHFDGYALVARIDDEEEVGSVLEDTNVLVHRVENAEEDRRAVLGELETQLEALDTGPRHPFTARDHKTLQQKIDTAREMLRLMKTIYFGFIVEQGVNKEALSERIAKLLEGHPRFRVTVDASGEIKLGDTTVSLISITATV